MRTKLPNSFRRNLDVDDLNAIRNAKREKLAMKKGRQSTYVFHVGDDVRIQDHVLKKGIQKGKMVEARQGDGGKNTSFQIETESGRVLLHHKNHIRPEITSTDRT